MVAEQQQHYKYSSPQATATSPIQATYDANKNAVNPTATTQYNVAANKAALPITKTNGYSSATTTTPPQQQPIDKVTGQPVPAPRRTNSVPQGEQSSAAETTTPTTTTSSVNGNIPTNADNSSSAQAETQV